MEPPARQYQVDRAVWLYQRLGRARALGASAKVRAITHRLTRWLVGADERQRVAYYIAICEVDQTETTHARVSRRRGRQLKRMVEASREYDAQFDREDDDAPA